MTITEFARSRNEQAQTISIYMKRHAAEFEGHTRKKGKSVELDEKAIEILDKVYPVPKPVQIINGVDPDEHKRVQTELEILRKKYEATLETMSKLQTQVIEDQKLIAQADAQKILLEDKQKQLEEVKKEKDGQDIRIGEQNQKIAELQLENERLKNRGLWARLLNK